MNTEITLLPNLIPKLYPKTSKVLSSNRNETPYIFDISSASNFCVVSTSDNELFSWNYSNDTLGKISYHTDTITNLKVHKNQLLISSSKDGSVAIWDLRAPKNEPTQILLGMLKIIFFLKKKN